MKNVIDFSKFAKKKTLTVLQDYKFGSTGLITNIRTQLFHLLTQSFVLYNETPNDVSPSEKLKHLEINILLRVVDDLFQGVILPFELTNSVGVRLINAEQKHSVIVTGIHLERFPNEPGITVVPNYCLEVQMYTLDEDEVVEGGLFNNTTFFKFIHNSDAPTYNVMELLFERVCDLVRINGGMGGIIDEGTRLLVLLPYSSKHAIAISLEGDKIYDLKLY